MIIFGSSIVWHEWKKKRKKNKALRSLDCCNLEYHPGRPEFICELKKKKGIWKEMWLLDDGMQRERNWKEREAEWSKMSTEKRGKKGQTLKKKKVYRGTRKRASKAYGVTWRVRWFTVLQRHFSRKPDTNTVCLSPQAADGHTILDSYTGSSLRCSSSL